MTAQPSAVLHGLDQIRGDLAEIYRDLHTHPELSFAEHRTAAEVARHAESYGCDVTTGVGGTGVVAVLRNGVGPTVLLRADFDALPVREQTGLPYASTATGTDPDGNQVPVMHACGHDMHATCLLGALRLLANSRGDWAGTVLAVFQPAEETGAGAQAMVDDGLYDRFPVPDVVLGQHVMPLPAGKVGFHAGPSFAATDSLRVRLFGKGGHGSRPEASVDPVVMAASTVLRLQTVVSREVAGNETAVLTVGVIQAGTKENIIPSEAELRLNIRSYDEKVRATMRSAVERIVRAEAAAAGAEREPEISPITEFPVVTNDPDAVAHTREAVAAVLGGDQVVDPGAVNGSEDVGIFGTAAGVPVCYWLFGGSDPEQADGDRNIPANHSPFFAPVAEPAIDTGVTALTTAALSWLGAGADRSG